MGLEVVSGVVDFYVTYGLPLPDILQSLKEQNRVPCWVSFIEEGKKLGWNMKTCVSRAQESIIDVHGRNYWLEMEVMFQKVVMKLYENV